MLKSIFFAIFLIAASSFSVSAAEFQSLTLEKMRLEQKLGIACAPYYKMYINAVPCYNENGPITLYFVGMGLVITLEIDPSYFEKDAEGYYVLNEEGSRFIKHLIDWPYTVEEILGIYGVNEKQIKEAESGKNPVFGNFRLTAEKSFSSDGPYFIYKLERHYKFE